MKNLVESKAIFSCYKITGYVLAKTESVAVTKLSLRNLKEMPFQQMHRIMKIARETAKNSETTKNDRDLYQHHATGRHYSTSGKQEMLSLMVCT